MPAIPGSTAETDSILVAHPAVIQAVDAITVNYYPYWTGTALQQAVTSIHRAHQSMVAAAGGKQVIVTETGWPSCWDPLGAAVPSPANASAYLLDFVSWACTRGTIFLLFLL